MKMLKKISLVLFSAVFMFVATMLFSTTSVKAASGDTTDAITTIGAQIRQSSPNGIRFISTIDFNKLPYNEEEYEQYTKEDIVTYGTLIGLGSSTTDTLTLNGTFNGKVIANLEAKELFDESKNQFAGSIIDIPAEYYDYDFTARAYITVKTGSYTPDEIYYAKEVVVRNMFTIATDLEDQTNAFVQDIINNSVHDFSEVATITLEPTETETGLFEKVCSKCSHTTETVVIPALTDTTEWTMTGEVEASYSAGSRTYVSETYGTVVFSTKLVAPYDNKVYTQVQIEAKTSDGAINAGTSWATATLTYNNEGVGTGTAYPFRGTFATEIVDAATGEVTLTSGTSVYKGYVDFASGIIIRQRLVSQTFDDVFMMSPYEVGVSSNSVSASSWDNKNAVAITYTYNNTTYTMFIYNNVVHFGVEFKDASDNNVDGKYCYSAQYLKVVDKDGNVIAIFGNNGTNLVKLDGNQGTYTSAEYTVVFTGYGVATVNGVTGTYKDENNDSVFEVYAGDSFYEVTINKTDMTCTAIKQVATITYISEEGAIEADEVSINIAFVLPTPTSDTKVFKGWFYDAEYKNPVEETFVPTADATLHALWKAKVVVLVEGGLEGDPTVLNLAADDVLFDYLPVYSIDTVNMKKFIGWYFDDAYEYEITEDYTVTIEDDNLPIYAVWEELPLYYGTYTGFELWGLGSGSSTQYTITIDENGNISGDKTGIVVSYDEVTQLVTWKVLATDATTKSFRLDAQAGIIAGIYGDNAIAADFYLLSKYRTNENISHYGISTIPAGSTSAGFYAQFISVMTNEGQKDIFVYNEHIYSNIEITATDGKTLTTSTISSSKNVVVKDKEGNVIFAMASSGATFSAKNDRTNVVLDEYWGTYTNESGTINFDGAGTVTYGEKTGTYALLNAETSTFEVYLQNNTEYYEVTLNESSFTITQPEVTISFNVGEGHTAIASIKVNKNVPCNLPSGDDAGYVFNGWYTASDFQTIVTSPIIPTADVTYYAKYSLPAVVTIVYNNGSENGEVIYSVGDTTDIPTPVYEKHAFVGWFTSADFAENTAWTSGNEISDDVTIYAKWEDAPVYNATYVPTQVHGNAANGRESSVYTCTAGKIDIDPYGFATGSAFPFNGDVEIKNYNQETGYLEIHMGAVIYKGYVDSVSGIIITTYNQGLTATFGQVMLLTPFETGSLSSATQLFSSYWDLGNTRCIQYVYGEQTYSFFIYEGAVYFNVEFKDVNGNQVNAKEAYKATSLFVYDENGEIIAKYGYDGTTMVVADDSAGVYTNNTDTLVLNGVSTAVLNGVSGTYQQAGEGAEYGYDLYVENSYYELTIDIQASTYVTTKVFVTITFNAGDYATVTAEEVNKNIEITLPTPTNEEYAFIGWFKEAELINQVPTNYVPTANEELFAKWAKKYIVTLNTNNEEAAVSVDVLEGMSYTPPRLTNGMAATWYVDAELTTPYVNGTVISSNLELYASLQDATVADFFANGDPKGYVDLDSITTSSRYGMTLVVEDGVAYLQNKNQGVNNSSSTVSFTVTNDCVITVTINQSSEKAYDYLSINGISPSIITKNLEGEETYTFNVSKGTTITFSYSKDGSSNSGTDTVKLSNFVVTDVE